MENEIVKAPQAAAAEKEESGLSLTSIVGEGANFVRGAVQGFAAGTAGGVGLAAWELYNGKTGRAIGNIAGAGAVLAAGAAAEAVRNNPEVAAGAALGGAIGAAVTLRPEGALAGAAAGAAGAAVGGAIAEQIQNHKDIAVGAVIGGAIGAAGLRPEGVVIGAAAGAVAGGAIEAARQNAEAAAIAAGAGAVAAGAALAGGDATRAIAAGAGAAIAAGVAKALEGMKKNAPAGCCPCTPVDMLKEAGQAAVDGVRSHPVEAGLAAALGGVTGLAGFAAGAGLRRAYEENRCRQQNLQEHLKNLADFIQKMGTMPLGPFMPPVVPIVPVVPVADPVKDVLPLVAPGVAIAAEAARLAAPAVVQAQNELQQHRAQNPTTATVERVAGYVVGGPIAGRAAGDAIQYADVKARQGWKAVKSLFGY